MTVTPSKNDVLFGRGKGISLYEGNIQFRSIVESRKSEYLKAPMKEKKAIALSIIHQISSMDPPGRFLMQDPNHAVGSIGVNDMGVWIPVDADKAAAKVGHCLREKSKEKNKGSSEEKKNEVLRGTETTPDFTTNIISCNKPSVPYDVARTESSAINATNLDVPKDVTRTKSSIASILVETEDETIIHDDIHPVSFRSSYSVGNSSNHSSETVSLREWINNAVTTIDVSPLANELHLATFGTDTSSWSLDVKIPLVTTSDNFIIPALKIAYFLASQICSVSGPGKGVLFSSDYDLVERVVVTQQVPLQERDSGVRNIPECKTTNTRGLNVISAKILPPSAWISSNQSNYDEAESIYRLGLALYELFSGGKMPSAPPTGAIARIRGALDLSNELSISDNAVSNPCLGVTTRCNKRGRSHHDRYSDQVTISVEPLRMQGVPASLCDLISNMLDCANGDLGQDEAYCCMEDVMNDLQLMLDKPDKFLRGIDVERLSVTGLELNSSVYGQERELASLQDCYRRALSRHDEFAILMGPSGSGKTVLANQFAEFVKSNGGIFLRGKFDQLQQSTPFAAITHAFNEYCKRLFGGAESDNTIKVASMLSKALGRDASYLSMIIPSLSLILGNSGEVTGARHDCVNTQKKLQYLLCRFVEVISSAFETPIVLLMDDLHWADEASVTSISRILLSSACSNFFFVGSCRDDEMSKSHPISKMISSVSVLGVKATKIKMKAMDNDTANGMVSEMLCLSPRLTRPLADIAHHKTKGNPLFLSRLMVSLSKKGLLRVSLSRRRWEWDETKIQSRKIPDDVAEFLTGTISQLSQDVQNALRTLSCFGASADIAVIHVLECKLGIQLQRALDVAASEGFLDKLNDKYQFCHDRIQEAAYSMLSQNEKRLLHSQYGVALSSHAIANENEASMLFTACDQINRGGKSVIMDAEQGSLMANLNLKAGMKAMEMGDFASALSFFEHGLVFLWDNHWKDHYDLSLNMYRKAAQCSYSVGNIDKLTDFVDQALFHALSFEDKSPFIYLTVSSLCDASMMDRGIKKGLWALSMLGEDISESPSRSDTISSIKQTHEMLRGFSNDALLGYKQMENETKIMAMKFLSRLAVGIEMSKNPSLLPVISAKMVQLSLVHGLTPMSAIGLVYFGSNLASIGHLEEGYRFVNVAKNIAKRQGFQEVVGEVIAISTQTIFYVEPMHSTADYPIKGHAVSMQSGDMRNATMNLFLFCNILFQTGFNLVEVKNKYEEGFRFANQHKIISFALIVYPLLQSLCKLIGSQDDSAISLLGNTAFTNEETLRQFLQQNNPHAARAFYYNKLFIPFIFREYDALKDYAEKFFEYDHPSWIMLSYYSAREFITGLASFLIYRRTKEQIWAERGNRSVEVMRKWAESSQWNFFHKYLLLEAEKHYCNGQHENAKVSYDRSIAFAKTHKFVNDEALACELAGHFLLETGKVIEAISYFTRAHQSYVQWGACAKALDLYEFVQSVTR